MPLGITTAERENEVGGQQFLIFTDASTRRIQTFALVDDTGAQTGIASSPLPVSLSVGTRVQYATAGTAVASAVIHNAAIELYEFRVLLDPSVTSTRYLMFFDAISLPANGTAPDWRAIVPPAGETSESWEFGLPFSTGCVAAISSTMNTLTVVGAGEAYFHAVRV